MSLSGASAPAGVFVLDRDLRIVSVHAAAPLGRVAAGQMGAPLADIDPAVHRVIAPAAARVFATGCAEAGLDVVAATGRHTVSLFGAPGQQAATLTCVYSQAAGSAASPAAVVQAVRESDVERGRREVVATMLRAEEVERRRIAAALHDDTVQVMIASMMAMDRVALAAHREGVPKLAAAAALARATLEEATDRTRRLMFELRPAVLLRDGIVAAVRVLVQQVGRETGAAARVRGTLGRYDHPIEELVYRSVQEALANVRKHARPEAISVTLVERGGTIRAEVCDDGLGFDMIDARTRPHSPLHLGLDTLHERIGAVGGTVEIISSRGNGTCVRLSVPLAGFEV
jgi:signal transduction histidine kinase